jgi:membrane-bound ClpP family serine protease
LLGEDEEALFKRLQDRLHGKISEIENEIDKVKEKKAKIEISTIDKYDTYTDMDALLDKAIKVLQEKNKEMLKEKEPEQNNVRKEKVKKNNVEDNLEIIPLGERFKIEKELAFITSWLVGIISFLVGGVYMILGHYTINNAIVMALGAFLMVTTLILMRKTN